MSLAGQRIRHDRYTVIPRTLTFLSRGRQVLLLRVPQGRGAWAGLYNGIGGHIEPGEDPLASARREVLEETGLTVADLRLCGVVLVDTGSRPGIGLYVFTGECPSGSPAPGPEGVAEWVEVERLQDVPLVEDLPMLLPRVLGSHRDQPPFSGNYRYDAEGHLSIVFAE